MTLFSGINLAQLPPPQVVEVLDFEAILSELKADAIARDPDLAEALELESEPLIKLLQVAAYRELVLRQRINDAARATMLAFATGNDLEQLGALFGVERGTVQAADPSANPPVLEILEDDTRLRTRIQLSLEGVTSCGTVGSYFVATLAASALVKDARVVERFGSERFDATFSFDGGIYYSVADHWAECRVYLARPITQEQAVQVRSILDLTAPLHCHLKGLFFTEALNTYNARISFDGQFTHGVA